MFEDTLSQVVQGRRWPAGPARRHQPGPGRPRRARRRHHHQLRPGRHPGHRPGHRRGDAGRRLLRRQAGRADVVQPRRRVLVRRLGPAGQPRRRRRPGLGGHRRPGEHQRPRRRAEAPDRPDRPAAADAPTSTSAATCRAAAAVGTTSSSSIDIYDSQGKARARHDDLHQDRRGRLEPERDRARRRPARPCRWAAPTSTWDEANKTFAPTTDGHPQRRPAERRRARVRRQRAGRRWAPPPGR